MHPLHDFKYCPHCGAQAFIENDAYSKRCTACDFTFYPNAAAATVAVIVNSRNELLCVHRKRKPAYGTLDLPGGFVDPGENIIEGLIREVREEIGAEVIAYNFLFSQANRYPFSGHEVCTADAFFYCRIADENVIQAGDDAEDIQWIPLNRLNPEDFGLHSIRKGVEQLLNDRNYFLSLNP